MTPSEIIPIFILIASVCFTASVLFHYFYNKKQLRKNALIIEDIKPITLDVIYNVKVYSFSYGKRNAFPVFSSCDLYITQEMLVIFPKEWNLFIKHINRHPLWITKENNELYITHQSKSKIDIFHATGKDVVFKFKIYDPIFDTRAEIKLQHLSDSDKNKLEFLQKTYA